MSDPFKPGSYFGRPLRSEGFEKIFGLTGAAALARPSAPSFSVASGMNDGEIDLTVLALPSSWGDLAVAGDGLGLPGWLEWRNEVTGWAVQIAPTPLGTPIILDLPAELWSSTATISLRGVSAAGRAGSVATQTVVVPGALQTLDSLVMPDTSPVEYLSDGPMTVLVPA